MTVAATPTDYVISGTELALAKAISSNERQDPAGKQETLAVLEGHDADKIPTEDQTSQPASYPPSLRSAKSAKSLKAGAAGHDEPLPANAAEKQALAAKEANGKTSHQNNSESSGLEKETDLEAGRHSDSTVDKKDVEVSASQTEPADPNIVDWDGPDDPNNPVNWSSKKKWGNIAIMAAITFLTYVALPVDALHEC